MIRENWETEKRETEKTEMENWDTEIRETENWETGKNGIRKKGKPEIWETEKRETGKTETVKRETVN